MPLLDSLIARALTSSSPELVGAGQLARSVLVFTRQHKADLARYALVGAIGFTLGFLPVVAQLGIGCAVLGYFLGRLQEL